MGENYYNDIINYVSHIDIRQEDIPFILSTFSDWIEALVKKSKPEFTEIKLGDIVFTYDDFTKLVDNNLLSEKLFTKTLYHSKEDGTLVFNDALLFGKEMDNFLPALSKKGIFNIMKYNLIKHSSISDKAEIHYINASDETSNSNKDPLKETVGSIKQNSLEDDKVHYILTDLSGVDNSDNYHVTLYVVVKDKIFEFDSVGEGIFDNFSTKFLQQSDESSCINIELKQLEEFLKIQEKFHSENKDNSIDKFYEYLTKFYSENGMESYVNPKDLNGDFVERTKSGDNITNKRLAIVDYINLKHEQSVSSLKAIKEALKNREGFFRDIKDNLEKLLDKKIIKMKYYDDKAKKFIDKDINSDTIKLRIMSPIILLEMLNKGLITDIKDNELYNKKDDSGTFTATINNKSINNSINKRIIKTPADKRDIVYYRKLILEKTEKLDENEQSLDIKDELIRLGGKLDNIIFEKFLDNNRNKDSAEYKFLYNCIVNNNIPNIEEYLTNIDERILKIGLDLVCICGNENIFDKLINNERKKQILLNDNDFLNNCFKDSFKFNKSEKIFKNLFDNGCKNNKELVKDAFEFACKTGDLNIINNLIDNENINDLDLKKGFYLSCLNGKTETFKKILEKIGDNIYKKEYKNILENGFYKVCEFGYTEIYKEIIGKIKDKKEYEYLVDDGFKYACRYGNLDVFKDLFEIVKDKDEVIADGFKFVCKNGNLENFNELFEIIGNNKEKNTYTIYECFLEVCENDNVEIFKKLFEFTKENENLFSRGFNKKADSSDFSKITKTHKSLIKEGFKKACENDSIEVFKELFEIAKTDKALLSEGFELAGNKASMKVYNKFFEEIKDKDKYKNILIDNFGLICFYGNTEVFTEIFNKIKDTDSEKISGVFKMVCKNNKKEIFEKFFEEIKDKDEYKDIIIWAFKFTCEHRYKKISERIYEEIKNKKECKDLIKEIFESACDNEYTKVFNRVYGDIKDKEEYGQAIINGFESVCENGNIEIFNKLFKDIENYKNKYSQSTSEDLKLSFGDSYTEADRKYFEETLDKSKYEQSIMFGLEIISKNGDRKLFNELFGKLFEKIDDNNEYKQSIIDSFKVAYKNKNTGVFEEFFKEINNNENYKQLIINSFENICKNGEIKAFEELLETVKSKIECGKLIEEEFNPVYKSGDEEKYKELFEKIVSKNEYQDAMIDLCESFCIEYDVLPLYYCLLEGGIDNNSEYKQLIIENLESICGNPNEEKIKKFFEEVKNKDEYKQLIVKSLKSTENTEILYRSLCDLESINKNNKSLINNFELVCKNRYPEIKERLFKEIKKNKKYRQTIINGFETVCENGNTKTLNEFLEKIQDREDYLTIIETGRKVAKKNKQEEILKMLPSIPKKKQKEKQEDVEQLQKNILNSVMEVENFIESQEKSQQTELQNSLLEVTQNIEEKTKNIGKSSDIKEENDVDNDKQIFTP